MGGAVAVLALVAALAGRGTALAGAEPSLPARIGAPTPFTNSLESAPLGHASVIFTSPTWWYDGSKGRVALVGDVKDDYGLVSDEFTAHAGEQAVLSPDGGRLATVGRVIDLATGKSRALPRLDAEFVVPQAWSPTGDRVAVIAYVAPYRTQPDGAMVPTATRATLHLVDPASGAAIRLGELDPGNIVDGWTVAFSPGGERIAFQSGQSVVVMRRDGVEISRFEIAAGSRLAGRGAWTPDGRQLTLASQQRCCEADAYQSRWTLSTVDVFSGAVTTAAWAEVTGVAAVRLINWSPEGRAIVVAYYPEPDAPILNFDTGRGTLSMSGVQLTDDQWIRSARVLSVGAGAQPTVLVTADEDQAALSLDAADDILASGVTRPGDPPYWTFNRLVRLAIPMAVLFLVLIIEAIVTVLAVRRRMIHATSQTA
jgi:hypothetical protein